MTEQTQQGATSHGQTARLNNTTTASVVSASTGQVMSSTGLPAHGMLGANSHAACQSTPMIGGLFTPQWNANLLFYPMKLQGSDHHCNQPQLSISLFKHKALERRWIIQKPNQWKGLFIRQFTGARRATITSLCRPLSTQEEVALYNQLLPKHTKGSKIKLRNAQGMMKCPGFSTTIW